jgi:hypothetical protein
MNMQNNEELLKRRNQLKAMLQTMDKDAPMHQFDGWVYASTLVKLVVVQLEIDGLKKEKAAQ